VKHQNLLKNKKKEIKIWAVIFIIAHLVLSCDFTPPINRKIIDAQNYITNQEYKKAAVLYEEILKNNLKRDLRIKLSFQLAELYSIYLGDYNKAVNYYIEAKELSDSTVWIIKIEEKLAEINFSYLKNYNESLKVFKRLVAFQPKLQSYDKYQFQIGMSYYFLRDYEKALEQFTLIQTNINNEYFINSFYQIGLIYYERREFSKALFVWSEYIKRETKKENIMQAKFLIANIYESTDNLKSAYDIYYSLLSDYPNTEIIQARLKSLYDRRVARRR
jgi:tetratricopeptide (TPR) repeat protein